MQRRDRLDRELVHGIDLTLARHAPASSVRSSEEASILLRLILTFSQRRAHQGLLVFSAAAVSMRVRSEQLLMAGIADFYGLKSR